MKNDQHVRKDHTPGSMTCAGQSGGIMYVSGSVSTDLGLGIQKAMGRPSKRFPNNYHKWTQREVGGTGDCYNVSGRGAVS